ncbi:MAG: succinate dehydrogenase cytochrome b subunit [Paramuribaculum sp.]|nr:succinate dehydrogenase cytochrome b subunit [Paramuribaculum sp.]MDE6489285.1 succinate dehydrogenase cytochrome b subunit [Paramuribaculum sp.]
MWLTCSSVGRKLVMSITGACLILFLTFHAVMNAVALFNPAAYNDVCEFLGANWYALIASAGLAALFIIHIIYAIWLTLQNRKARGNDRYNVVSKPPQVEWSSQNMLVLGFVVVAFLVVHLIQFWAKMQWQELRHAELSVLPQLDGVPVQPAMGTLFLQIAFSQIWTPIVYIIGFIALWFHMNHGFWSMFQSCGWNNDIWINRLKKISLWWSSIVVLLFIAQAVVFTVKANDKSFLTDVTLQEQYAESWNVQAEALVEDFQAGLTKQMSSLQAEFEAAQATGDQAAMQALSQKAQQAQGDYVATAGAAFVEKADAIVAAYDKQCPDLKGANNAVAQLQGMAMQIKQMLSLNGPAAPQSEVAAEDAEIVTETTAVENINEPDTVTNK